MIHTYLIGSFAYGLETFESDGILFGAAGQAGFLSARLLGRCSHQIRMQADRLLGPEVSDVDGNKEERKGTVSVFNGPPPDIRTLPSQQDETREVCAWLRARINEGVTPHEIGVFVRSATPFSI